MINVLISDPFVGQVEPETLEHAAQMVLQTQALEVESDLSVVIEDDEFLKSLNSEFRKIDAPTDVLSFHSGEGEGEVDPETNRPYLGDVIISFPRASEQAAAAGHAVSDEITLLAVHGVLHLLGYDHAEDEEKDIMWSAQRDVLDKLGVHLNRLPE